MKLALPGTSCVKFYLIPYLPGAAQSILLEKLDMSGNPPQKDEDWIAAEEAFAAARQIQGPERFDALKRAGQLRYHAHQKLLIKILERDDLGAARGRPRGN